MTFKAHRDRHVTRLELSNKSTQTDPKPSASPVQNFKRRLALELESLATDRHFVDSQQTFFRTPPASPVQQETQATQYEEMKP
jgi:hypothetical protein